MILICTKMLLSNSIKQTTKEVAEAAKKIFVEWKDPEISFNSRMREGKSDTDRTCELHHSNGLEIFL